MSTAYLILESGAVFKGETFGYEAEVLGELVFNTGMTGYLETLTDPSYFGQIVLQTFPLIGNYGVISPDFESGKVQVKAYIVREWCQEPSNFRNEGELDTFLRQQKIPGLSGLDTRALTKLIRENGVTNALLSKTPDVTPERLRALRAYKVTGGVDAQSTKGAFLIRSYNRKYSVVLWDFGAKKNMIAELNKRGCDVTIVPSTYTAGEILALAPDGIMLSNGPGDPAENTRIIAELRRLCEHNIPTFGICLGHQLLALANGARTKKLLYGHRGTNQPVMDSVTGRVYITSQNHGYAVDIDSLPSGLTASYVNCNDGTCEGVGYADRPFFSVQFHPEANAGPLDSACLFDVFIDMIERGVRSAKK